VGEINQYVTNKKSKHGYRKQTGTKIIKSFMKPLGHDRFDCTLVLTIAKEAHISKGVIYTCFETATDTIKDSSDPLI
jgi:hypothetical protein